MITGMNHAVLYVRDARRQQRFYQDILGFSTVIEHPDGAFVFLRAPGSTNHHDLACFTIGADARPSEAGRTQVGLYHIAWEVPTLDDLEAMRHKLQEAGALKGASDHGANKSLYAMDPDGLEFEVMWLVPAKDWGEAQDQAIINPLDIQADIARFGRDQVSTSHRIAAGPTPASLAAVAEHQHCHFFDDAKFEATDRPGFRRHIITGDELQLCFWRIKGGAQGSFMHHHDHHEQLGMIMRGGLDFRIGDPDDPERVVLRPGDSYLAAKGVDHGDSIFIGDDDYDECWILDVFAPPRADLQQPAKASVGNTEPDSTDSETTDPGNEVAA